MCPRILIVIFNNTGSLIYLTSVTRHVLLLLFHVCVCMMKWTVLMHYTSWQEMALNSCKVKLMMPYLCAYQIENKTCTKVELNELFHLLPNCYCTCGMDPVTQWMKKTSQRFISQLWAMATRRMNCSRRLNRASKCYTVWSRRSSKYWIVGL